MPHSGPKQLVHGTVNNLIKPLMERMAMQRERLQGPPIPARFSYDRNGLRLGISAIEDELEELLVEWRRYKRHLSFDENARRRIAHEVLDIASVAMLIYEEIPEELDGET